MSELNTTDNCRNLYLDLLKKALSNTVFSPEPDITNNNKMAHTAKVISHYFRSDAVTLLPTCRLDSLRWTVEQVIRNGVPGDLMEAGVWRGGASIYMRALLEAYEDKDRQMWVADSFEGHPEPDAERHPRDAAFYNNPIFRKFANRHIVGLEEVRRNFAAYGLLDDRVHFIKGFFKDTLPVAPVERLAILRLDADSYQATMDSLIYLYDKVSVGGFVIIDDYGDADWNCREAVDSFRQDRGIRDPLVAIDKDCHWWCRSALH